MERWIAIAAPGLEPVVDRELRELGVEGELEPGAIVFDAPLQTGADLTTQARTPARLLLRVAEAPVSNTRQLGDLIRAVDREAR